MRYIHLEFVLDEPKAVAVITNVGDSNIILEFQIWVDQSDTDYSKARSIAIRETKHALENEGFSLPEPIYRLRFKNNLEKAFENMQANANTDSAKSDMTITPITPKVTDKNQNEDNSVDDKDKKQAKARAKLILQGRNADEVLNARPDDKLMEKVEQEIAESSDETDLLNNNSPQE